MFGKIKDYKKIKNKVEVEFENKKVNIVVINDYIVNVFVPMKDANYNSYAIENDNVNKMKFEVINKEKKIIVKTEQISAHIYDNCKIDFYNKNNQIICKDYRGKREPFIRRTDNAIVEEEGQKLTKDIKKQPVEIMKENFGDEKFYGLGDKTGHLNKKNYRYEMWNTDDPTPHVESFETLYKTIPFLITLRDQFSYGLFFDNTYRSFFDMGKENTNYFYYGAEGGDINYYFIYGPEVKNVIKNYNKLTGTTPLPQLWTLGHQQSRFSYDSEKRVREIAEKFREKEIPCDAIHLDIDYMDGYRIFTWDKKKFPNLKKLVNELHEDGFKVVTIIDPGIKKDSGYKIFNDCLENGYYITDKDGIPYVNEVWPGECIYPDFTNSECRNWWGNNHNNLINLGIDGIWNDMNEPASFNGPLPDNVKFKNGGKPILHKEAHNIYGHLMSKSTYKGLKAITGKRPFVITRACYAGSQKYSTVWTGDNQSLWEHLRMSLPMLMNLGISGFSFSGTDIGGFGFDTTPELLTRWYQANLFAPLYRNHSSQGTRDQEPWAFDNKTEKIIKKFIDLRYQLIPYIYDLIKESEDSGLPVIRPLFLQYQDDQNTYNLNDQYLVGENILMAPVVSQGEKNKKVYLPDDEWIDYWTGEEYNSKQFIIKNAPIDIVPMYIKKGSIIPNYKKQNFIGENQIDNIILDIYPGNGEYMHYQDDGETFNYKDGEYNLYKFVQKEYLDRFELDLVVEYQKYEKVYKKTTLIFNSLNINKIEVNGKEVEYTFKKNSVFLALNSIKEEKIVFYK
ncbi:DUF4968 domain-containing protein [Halocella sp. SP3-1]|nr:glycoside hydrolase family 31 protein [Halocella sp. SP3-1]AZO93223.1 DUF4968 domain-containing protein [Halocella sp. SP3-1]